MVRRCAQFPTQTLLGVKAQLTIMASLAPRLVAHLNPSHKLWTDNKPSQSQNTFANPFKTNRMDLVDMINRNLTPKR